MATFTLALHGGAGTILKEDMTPELEATYLHSLEEALDAGYKILESGGAAVAAVKETTIQLENNILFLKEIAKTIFLNLNNIEICNIIAKI